MQKTVSVVEKIPCWIGSLSSLFLHTVAFIVAFALGIFHIFAWNDILLILTTAVSLEAIYLAIFIQMSVNQNSESLREVEEDVDEIQKDIDALSKTLR